MKIYNRNDLEKSMVIYKIENLTNGKVYIGQTVDKLKRRVIKSYKFNRFLKRAFKLHGIENFELSLLEQCSNMKELNRREQFWISFYNSTDNQKGYNLQSGGKNCRMHESTKKILSEKCSGWHHTEKAKQKISEAQTGDKHWAYGKKFSVELCKKLREAHIGIGHTQATKDKMSKTRKGMIITWGDKISKSKCKITEKEILNFIAKNPYATVKDIMKYFKLRTNGAIHRLGGLRRLRRKIFKVTNVLILCPLCKKSFKVLNNTHLQYKHKLQTKEERREMLLSFRS